MPQPWPFSTFTCPSRSLPRPQVTELFGLRRDGTPDRVLPREIFASPTERRATCYNAFHRFLRLAYVHLPPAGLGAQIVTIKHAALPNPRLPEYPD